MIIPKQTPKILNFDFHLEEVDRGESLADLFHKLQYLLVISLVTE